MISQRYFSIADESLYEDLRLTLDAGWNHSPPVTCVDPASVAPRDDAGRIVLSVRSEVCDYEAVSAILPGLLSFGHVVEITAAEYQDAITPTTP